MNIAQSQIAGEATLRLHDIDIHAAELVAALAGVEPADNDDNSDDCPDDELDFVVDETRLPYIVLQANHRARSLKTLPLRARNTLGAIALTVDQHQPLNSVFARRKYLADRAGQSLRTLQRSLTDLLDAGMIRSELSQNRKRSGEFAGRFIYLTDMAARLLGFLQAPAALEEAKAPVADSVAQPRATLSGRAIYRFYQSPSSQKRQPGDLPEDVTPLQAMGFSTFHIFALMRSARVDHGKRLGDVVAVAGELLAKAKHPRAYLATLLRSATDFAFLARQRRAKSDAAAHAAATAIEQEGLQARIAGQVFYERDAAKRYAVSTDGAQLVVRDPQEGADRMAAPGWIAGMVKGLRTAQLVPASPWLDARFAERLEAGLAGRPTGAAAWSAGVGQTSRAAGGAETPSREGGGKGALTGAVQRAKPAAPAASPSVAAAAGGTVTPGALATVADYLRAATAPRARSAAMEACMATVRKTLH
ncbi:hypothetical protein [Cupriavidus sp. TMH.W2]|uniref:hypothetical protein n=1 Tax=Cupriavidus sp. TMH.W2 TaxID=3434465 RepID=UPI003D787656